jgi:hypothetical protein
MRWDGGRGGDGGCDRSLESGEEEGEARQKQEGGDLLARLVSLAPASRRPVRH